LVVKNRSRRFFEPRVQTRAALSTIYKKAPAVGIIVTKLNRDLFGASLRLTLRAPFGREKSLPAIF
jgi:hypothetical protein